MATAFAPAPFLVDPRRKETRPDLIHARRSTRMQVAQLLCTRGGNGARSELSLSRAAVAAELGIGLCKVKRVMALLSLSGAIACEGDRLRILDWRRLCEVAQVPCAVEAEEEMIVAANDEEVPAALFTAAGDPACFV